MIRRILSMLKRREPTKEVAVMRVLARYPRDYIQRLQADTVLQQDEWTAIGRFKR